MNSNRYIISGALALILAGGLQACREDDFDAAVPGRDELISRGQYLAASRVDASGYAGDVQEPFSFEVGTPYRLLAFVKEYKPENPYDKTPALYPRFNIVASEGEVKGRGLRYINIENAEKLLGFSALPGEPGADRDDNLVSFDFYGFSYGEVTDPATNYLELDGIAGETVPRLDLADQSQSLDKLKRTESVADNDGDGNPDADGELKDLMRGRLMNQNITTAGMAEDGDGNWVANPRTQSILQFDHSFSRLHFFVSQQGAGEQGQGEAGTGTGTETTAESQNPVFENLYVDGIEVTGTYGKGEVFLSDGKINLTGDKMDRSLPFRDEFTGEVKVNTSDAGEIIVFPSDGSALKNSDMADGYDVGLNITVRSTVRNDIKNMLVNTGSVGADGEPAIEEVEIDGKTWYRGKIVKQNITDYYDAGLASLRFKQNTAYVLIIAFQKGAVRIITIVPQVEEWLPGESNSIGEPYDYQEIGQPQMFDNIVWSDRNLGADQYDPTGDDYEETVGYFYQAGRNIPYYPFKWGKYVPEGAKLEDFYSYDVVRDMYNQKLVNGSSDYNNSEYSFYPVVDPAILKMYKHKDKKNGDGTIEYEMFDDNWNLVRLVDFQWLMWGYNWNGQPQMDIPESMPADDHYFNYMIRNAESGQGLTDDQDMHWELGQSNQPTSGSWIIPSSRQFLTIFPSTPHAGNITFRRGYGNGIPMGWGEGDGSEMSENVETLRITIPYYYDGMTEPSYHSDDEKVKAIYKRAWQTLYDHNDPGTTHTGKNGSFNVYHTEPGSAGTQFEPDGDPADGFASVYVISRKGEDKYTPKILPKGAKIKSWGTIYAIKRIYTSEAYRMRWRVLEAEIEATNPCYYIEICRYRAKADDGLTEENYSGYDWEHPVAKLYFPICGLGDWNGQYINFGTECQYATSDEIVDNKTSVVQIKVTGNDTYNAYISVVRNVVKRDFGMQIRPVMGGGKW